MTSIFRFISQLLMLVIEALMFAPERVAAWLIASFKKSEYVRKGACIKCGQCCQAIGMEFPKWWLKTPWLIALTKRWHFLRYNFRFVELQNNMLVYECLYQKPDQTCGIYCRRPALCRNFPVTPLFGCTKLHEGCEFVFVKRKVEKFEEVLQKHVKRKKD